MPLYLSFGRRIVRADLRPIFIGTIAAAAFIGLVGLNTAARAADDGSEAQASAWSKFMQSLGLKKSAEAAGTDAGISYIERAPLVVPPSRDLPLPGQTAGMPADWPKDPANDVKRSKAKPGVVADTAVQTPNPPYQKKPWYNPAGWFEKEEYATFAGEPVRAELTDPPAGYRVPSAAQPYGINPEKAKRQATAQDFGYAQIGGGGSK